MIWPFNRRARIVDRRRPNDFRPGDMVECIRDDWMLSLAGDPVVGDVLRVTAVRDRTWRGIRAYCLRFACLPGRDYEIAGFRKIVDTDDAALIAQIKRVPVRAPEPVAERAPAHLSTQQETSNG